MDVVKYAIRKLIAGIPLVLGVTFVSFLLMVYFGPDKTYELLGKNPTAEQIAEVRAELGYDQPFSVRYPTICGNWRRWISASPTRPASASSAMLTRTIPISLALATPGFILGNLLGVVLALSRRITEVLDRQGDHGLRGRRHEHQLPDRDHRVPDLLSSSYGLNLFPVRGWNVTLLTTTSCTLRCRRWRPCSSRWATTRASTAP